MFKNSLLAARWALLGLCMAFTSAYAAPTLQINASGILKGATGVEVNGSLYDVAFVDGTCVGLFSGCDSPGDFAFPGYGLAQSASLSLLAQVFLDVPGTGNFNSLPSLTGGCSVSSACFVFTPYGLASTSVLTISARNNEGTAIDQYGPIPYYRTEDTSASLNATWAVWSPHVAEVPEPGSTAMLAAGLALVAARRKFGEYWRAQRLGQSQFERKTRGTKRH